jgi:hypothetical protein
MAGRVFQQCVRDMPNIRVCHVQVATKVTNPLTKKKKAVDTTFTTKGENIAFRSQQKKVTPEEDVQYRRAEIVANMVGPGREGPGEKFMYGKNVK